MTSYTTLIANGPLMLFLQMLILLCITNCKNNTGSNAPPKKQPRVEFAVNAGGAEYTASSGIIYQTDTAFIGGFPHESRDSIAQTQDDALYKVARYGKNFSYQIPLENGIYNLVLLFTENYNSVPGERQFDVLAEGREIIPNLDVFGIAGKNTAYIITKTLTVKDDTLNLNFVSHKGDAMVAAFHLEKTGSYIATSRKRLAPIEYAVNGGGSTYRASNGITYEADKNFSGGFSHQVNNAIANTTDDLLYQTGHYGTKFSYDIPLSKGVYYITFHFVENYNSAPHLRQFNVIAEDKKIVSNLDIFNATGKSKAYTLVKEVLLTDSILNLKFEGKKGDAMVSAFYITKKSAHL